MYGPRRVLALPRCLIIAQPLWSISVVACSRAVIVPASWTLPEMVA